jgi:hypothetical protein
LCWPPPCAPSTSGEGPSVPAEVQRTPGTPSWTKSRPVTPFVVVSERKRMIDRLSGGCCERSRGDARLTASGRKCGGAPIWVDRVDGTHLLRLIAWCDPTKRCPVRSSEFGRMTSAAERTFAARQSLRQSNLFGSTTPAAGRRLRPGDVLRQGNSCGGRCSRHGDAEPKSDRDQQNRRRPQNTLTRPPSTPSATPHQLRPAGGSRSP